MTMSQAYALLPQDAEWSCCFGNPGESGFTEYHRTPSGQRWIVSNGPNGDDWKCRPEPPAALWIADEIDNLRRRQD